MESKIIAFRINPENYKIIEKVLSTHSYLNRSVVINRILNAFLKCASREDVDKIITSFDAYDEKIVIKLSTLNVK